MEERTISRAVGEINEFKDLWVAGNEIRISIRVGEEAFVGRFQIVAVAAGSGRR